MLATRRKDFMCAWGLGELSAQGWNVSKKREVKRKILNEFFFVVLRVGVAWRRSADGDESWAKEEKFLMIGKIRIHTLDEIRQDCTQFSALPS